METPDTIINAIGIATILLSGFYVWLLIFSEDIAPLIDRAVAAWKKHRKKTEKQWH